MQLCNDMYVSAMPCQQCMYICMYVWKCCLLLACFVQLGGGRGGGGVRRHDLWEERGIPRGYNYEEAGSYVCMCPHEQVTCMLRPVQGDQVCTSWGEGLENWRACDIIGEGLESWRVCDIIGEGLESWRACDIIGEGLESWRACNIIGVGILTSYGRGWWRGEGMAGGGEREGRAWLGREGVAGGMAGGGRKFSIIK